MFPILTKSSLRRVCAPARLISAAALLFVVGSAPATIVISEVDPSGSASTNGYNQDWFELTNTDVSPVDITGWKMDDNSHTFASAVALRGLTSIAAGQSVVFVEDGATSTNDATVDANFENYWFGSNVPAGFTIANYGGSGVGLSQTADEVNIYDSVGNQVAGVGFGATATGITLDNSAGLGGTSLPDPIISTVSVAGVNSAFSSANANLSQANEVGSPGAVPEPTSAMLLCFGASLLLRRRVSRA